QEAPGRGYHWGMATPHSNLPRGTRIRVGGLRLARQDPRLELSGHRALRRATQSLRRGGAVARSAAPRGGHLRARHLLRHAGHGLSPRRRHRGRGHQADGDSDRVLCALSGGVDSSVVAVLLHGAFGDQLTCLFVDNGLLRKGEAEAVVATFRDAFKINLIHVDASKRFLDRLLDVTDPETKRKRIGNEFIAVFEEEAGKLGEIPWLAQGTLYPDVIESVSFKGPSAVIKTHHT